MLVPWDRLESAALTASHGGSDVNEEGTCNIFFSTFSVNLGGTFACLVLGVFFLHVNTILIG